MKDVTTGQQIRALSDKIDNLKTVRFAADRDGAAWLAKKLDARIARAQRSLDKVHAFQARIDAALTLAFDDDAPSQDEEPSQDYTITLTLGVTADSIPEAIANFLADATDTNLALTFTVTHEGSTVEHEYDHNDDKCSSCDRSPDDPHTADCPAALAQDLETGDIRPGDDSYSDAHAAYAKVYGRPFVATEGACTTQDAVR